ncbi:DNA methyltransferase, partial [Campylobacter lari]|nr:DNA methyltransferase [Campylobacter lari]
MTTLSSFNISARRYLGNKTKLLPFILNIINKNCKNIKSVADIFSGTGVVASAFIDKIIYTNDILQ